jgi:hypothetical protein
MLRLVDWYIVTDVSKVSSMFTFKVKLSTLLELFDAEDEAIGSFERSANIYQSTTT